MDDKGLERELDKLRKKRDVASQKANVYLAEYQRLKKELEETKSENTNDLKKRLKKAFLNFLKWREEWMQLWDKCEGIHKT